jgi:radical SAM protein with 4Fe4S-binding SPASM domain
MELNLIIILGNECNFSCLYCYIGDKHIVNSRSINFDKIKETVFDKVLLFDSINIEFSGEINQHLDFIEVLINSLKEKYKIKTFQFFFQLNGSEISKQTVEFIKRYTINIGLSSDGNKLINDKTRKFKNQNGAGKIIENAITTLQNNNIHFSIRCTITKYNYKTVEQLLQTFNDNRPSSVFLNRLIYKNNAIDNYAEIAISFDEYWGFYNEYNMKAIEMDALNLVDNNLKRWIYRFNNNPKGWLHSCSTNFCSNIFVLTNDSEYQCPKFIESEVISKAKLDEYRILNCENCETLQYCNGGCPLGNNYAKNGLSDECMFVNNIYQLYQDNVTLMNKLIKTN